jgi:hypothetical protein
VPADLQLQGERRAGSRCATADGVGRLGGAGGTGQAAMISGLCGPDGPDWEECHSWLSAYRWKSIGASVSSLIHNVFCLFVSPYTLGHHNLYQTFF